MPAFRQTIALTGDSMLSRRVSVFRDKPFLRLRDILQKADAVFNNFESNVNAYLSEPHAQRNGGGGTYMTTEPALLDELKWLGINMLACGSSHADDYGPNGILNTIRHLDAAGLVHAGSGRNLAEARAPGYLDTSNGRFALIAANAQFTSGSRAGGQRIDTPGWPGVNGLRHKTVHYVTKASLDDLRRIGREIGWAAAVERARHHGDAGLGEDSDTSYNFMGQTFRLGQEPRVESSANKSDIEENLRQVKNARLFADRVIVSLHCHEQGGRTLLTAKRRADVEDLADYAVDFGRRCIDAGADVFVAHGPQIPLAVEIYKGKPLFHGIGTFLFQIETIKYFPDDAYERYGLGDRATPADFIHARYKGDTAGHTVDPEQWEQFFAVCEFQGDVLAEVRLHPIDLGFKRRRTDRGRPVLASGRVADQVLGRVEALSKKYGTVIARKGDVGIIRPKRRG